MVLVNFLMKSDAPVGSNVWSSTYLAAHLWFFLFNFLNLTYIFLIEGIVFKRLGKNFLLKVSCAASSFQLVSCINSIISFNIMEPYGLYGHLALAFGLIAYFFMSSVYVYVAFQRNEKAIRLGVLVCMLACVVTFIITELNWTEIRFGYFRILVALSTLFQFGSSIIGLNSIRSGSLTISSSIISTDDMLGLSKMIIIVYVASLALSALGVVTLIYPATGMTYTLTLITASYFGRMDFMLEGNSGEMNPINV